MSTMILIALTLHSFSTLVFVVASVREELLQPNTNQTMIPPLALNISEPLFTSNESFAPTNISLGTDFDIQCDWQQYGFINTPSDCQAAWQSWPRDAAEYTLVPRRGPQRDPDAYALPLMTMGLGAQCYFELTMKSGRSRSRANFLDIRTASAALVQSCIINQAISQGGIARSPGGDNNMDLAMAEYAPRAQCDGPGTFPMSTANRAACAQILEVMEISRRPIVFGPAADPTIQVTTPYVILAHNMECGLAVESSEQTDSESWYKLWQEANAIYSHCLRQGESGHSEGLGDRGRIKLTMGDAEPQDLASNGSMGTVMIA